MDSYSFLFVFVFAYQLYYILVCGVCIDGSIKMWDHRKNFINVALEMQVRNTSWKYRLEIKVRNTG